MNKTKIKTNIKQGLKTIILYGSFAILAGSALDYALIKGLLAVQLPQETIKCQETINEPSRATSTSEGLPEAKNEVKKEAKGTIREVTAYNSVEAQTDSTPCIGADGTDLCQRYEKGECLVATNAYPLGTKLEIQGFGACTVADRMNKRYKERVDIFMNKEVERAIKFGKQNLLVAEM